MDPKELLKMNAKKLTVTPRAFYFAEDKASGEKFLHIDRKFDNPKRFGNLKKIQTLLSKGFEVELSKTAKICAGLAHRDEDGTVVFQPSIQKANAALLKKGIKTFKKQLGAARVDLTGGDESTEEDAPADTGALRSALETLLEQHRDGTAELETLSGDARAVKTRAVGTLTDKALDALDNFIVASAAGKAEDAQSFLLMRLAGRSLQSWQEHLTGWQADSAGDLDDDDEMAESLRELEAEVVAAKEEIRQAEALVDKTKERLDQGNERVTDTILDQTLSSLLNGKELVSIDKILKDSPKLSGKLVEVVSSHSESVSLLKQSKVKLELSSAKIETLQAKQKLSVTRTEREEVTVKLTDSVLDRTLSQVLKEKPLSKLSDVTSSLVDKVKLTVTRDEDARDEVTRTEQLEVVLVSRLTALQAQQNLEKLQEEAFSEKRQETRSVSRSIMDGHHATIKVDIAKLRKAARGGDEEAATRLAAEEATSKRFGGLKGLGLSLDGLTLSFDTLTEQLGSLASDEMDVALTGLLKLRADAAALKTQLSQLA
ncbi:MAG: hypothetical protein ACI8S6_003328 [Myxococcota bacterium]|jgi:hypothetical protein